MEKVQKGKDGIYTINALVWSLMCRTSCSFKTKKQKLKKMLLMCCLDLNSINL